MEPNIKNFSEIERLIKNDPKRADAQAFEWQQFLKTYSPSSPELLSIETSEDFHRWAQEHPEKNIDTSVWAGKEISETYGYLRNRHEESQMTNEGGADPTKLPSDLASTPLLAALFLQKSKIMEDNRHYQKIEENLKKEWLKNNPGKDFSSKEGIDYLYGSLENGTKNSLHKEAEEAFRRNPKHQRDVERYDREAKKIYKDHERDPRWWEHEHKMQREIGARLELLEKTRDKKTKPTKEQAEKAQKEIIEQVRKRSQAEFAQSNPEKADVYFRRMEAKNRRRENKEQIRINISAPSTQGSAINPPLRVNQAGNVLPPRRASGGRINRGINSINKLMRGGIKNPFGKLVGPRATLLRGFAAFLAGPGFPIVVALVSVFVLTFIIIMFGGAPLPNPSIPTGDMSP